MKIIRVPDLGSTPARVHRPSGTVYLNMRLWPSIDSKVQKVILAHEEGHHKLNTKSEQKADEYAFHKFALSEKGSLKALYRAVTKHLDMNKTEHRLRAVKQIKRILKTDANLGNTKARKILSKMNENTLNAIRVKLMAENPEASLAEIDEGLQIALALKDENNYSDFGLKKKAASKNKVTALAKLQAKKGHVLKAKLRKPVFRKVVASAASLLKVSPKATAKGIAKIVTTPQRVISRPLVKKIAARPLVKKIAARPLVKKIAARPLVKKIAARPVMKRIAPQPLIKRVVAPSKITGKPVLKIIPAPAAIAINKKIQATPKPIDKINIYRLETKKRHPQATLKEIDLALEILMAVKEDLSPYSDATGRKKGGLKRFFDKAGDKFRKVADKPAFKGVVATAAGLVGVPPRATEAALSTLNNVSKANVAKLQAQRTVAAQAQAEAQAQAQTPVQEQVPNEQPMPEVAANQSPVAPLLNAGTTATTSGGKKSLPLATWLGIAATAGVVLYFVMSKK